MERSSLSSGSEISARTPALSLSLTSHHTAALFQILQRGFRLRVRVGSSVRSVLCDQLGLDPTYLEERVQTVFLNGKAVDNLDASIIEEGSTVALSSAMPGMVGATFRRGGYYSAMRSQITYREGTKSSQNEEGMFTLKLFNLLMHEVGPHLLSQGVLITTEALMDFLITLAPGTDFKAELDGRTVDLETLKNIGWTNKCASVHLTLQLIEGGGDNKS
jgi:hypothetical protein